MHECSKNISRNQGKDGRRGPWEPYRVFLRPIKINEIKTPKLKDNACNLIFCFDSFPSDTKLKIFKDIIGKTHGIRLSIKPPMNANIIACKKLIDEPVDEFFSI